MATRRLTCVDSFITNSGSKPACTKPLFAERDKDHCSQGKWQEQLRVLGAFNSLVAAATASSESEAVRVEFNLVYDVTPFVILPHTHYTG